LLTGSANPLRAAGRALFALDPSCPQQINAQGNEAEEADAQHHQQTDFHAAHKRFPPRVIRDRRQK